jgi:serine protease Do
MGVSAQEITPQIAKAMGLETTRGALVVEVENGSPAQKAGIKQGDVLVSINGNEVRDASSIRLYISEVLPGTKVPVRLIRNGKTLTVNVTMGDLSKAQNAGEKYTVKDNRFLEGATVSDLTSGIRETLKIADNIKGVVTVSVQENTPAASMGIRPSDVIVQINGMKIGNLSEFKQALKKMQGRKATIGIYRQGMLMTMTLVR